MKTKGICKTQSHDEKSNNGSVVGLVGLVGLVSVRLSMVLVIIVGSVVVLLGELLVGELPINIRDLHRSLLNLGSSLGDLLVNTTTLLHHLLKVVLVLLQGLLQPALAGDGILASGADRRNPNVGDEHVGEARNLLEDLLGTVGQARKVLRIRVRVEAATSRVILVVRRNLLADPVRSMTTGNVVLRLAQRSAGNLLTLLLAVFGKLYPVRKIAQASLVLLWQLDKVLGIGVALAAVEDGLVLRVRWDVPLGEDDVERVGGVALEPHHCRRAKKVTVAPSHLPFT